MGRGEGVRARAEVLDGAPAQGKKSKTEKAHLSANAYWAYDRSEPPDSFHVQTEQG